ncbi:MAG: PD40 domain-containing protein [Acidobacteria bacterium]|nr:PD40 domain-containing protein [Acidobacteriota bacterium]
MHHHVDLIEPLLAYASDRGGAGLHIWVQPLPIGDPVQITSGDEDDRDPNFSPDGSRIAFRSERDGGGIYVVPALGGAERLIAPKGYTPAFAPDGRRIAYITGGRGQEEELWLVDEAGGEPRRLAADIRIVGLGTVWMKDGSTLVVVGRVRESTTTDWWSVDVASGKASPMGAAETFTRAGFASVGQPAAVLNDRIVFSDDADRSHSMWSTALTADGRVVRGEPRRLTGGTRFDSSPSIANGPDGAQLYYASLDLRANLYRLPVVANEGRAHGEPQPITDTATTNAWPSLSGDGSTLAFGSLRGAVTGAWLRDMATGREIPAASAVLSMPNTIMLSPDGRTVALSGSDGIALQPVGGGTRQLLKDTGRSLLLWDWPAPSMIIVGNGELLAVNAQTGSKRPLISGGKPGDYYGHGRLSPDGKWISAMQWTNADQARVMVFPFRDTPVPPEEWIGITDGNTVAEEHAWSPDGNLLYIVSEKDGYRCVWAQRHDPQSKHPVGALMPVAHFHRARLQTAATPQRIVLGPQGLIFSMDERRGNIWMATVK